jgi:outer membrane protein assembly factor BamB
MRLDNCCRPRIPFLGIVALFAALWAGKFAYAEDWTHWRGPYQTGFSPDKGLPDEWDPRTPKKNNLIWKEPYGCRSTPVIMGDKLFIISADNDPLNVPNAQQKAIIGERVICLNADTGKLVWEQRFNVFHTDIVTNRLGWAPLAGDPKTNRVYAHTTAGFLFCFEGSTGKILWQHQLTEEYGRVTGYGGRIGGGPLFDSGLVIVGLVNSSWGNQGVGGNRFFAFDGETGKMVWSAETPNIGAPGDLKGTYYSNPVSAVINGERLMVTGGADGGIHAFQIRTGKRVWSLKIAVGVVNPSPVIDGNLVYICHGEENPAGVPDLGRVVCLDAGVITDGKPKVVWDYAGGVRFGLATPALANDRLYCPDDYGGLHCFDAKKGPIKGKPLWKVKYGTVSRGGPLIADGKIYIAEPFGKFQIIKIPAGDKAPADTDFETVSFKPKPGAVGVVESNCTPAAVNGRVYFGNRDDMFCIGTGKAQKVELMPEPKEDAGDKVVTQIQVIPSEIAVAPGARINYQIKTYNSKGVEVVDPDFVKALQWTLTVPPVPKGQKQAPPALDAVIHQDMNFIAVNPKKPSQQAYLDIKTADGKITGRSRVRVVPQIPYTQDFEKVPVGAAPAGWVNAQGKYKVVEEMGTNNKVLFKVNDNPRPPLARANAYITMPDSTNYTIQADMKGVAVREQLGDMGLIANRYLLLLDPKTTQDNPTPKIRLVTWEALPPEPAGRVGASVPYKWAGNIWYTVKLTVDVSGKEAIVRGKVWPREGAEPTNWMIELKDPRPNREGAAALYGYVPNATAEQVGAEIYYDNVKITPNGNGNGKPAPEPKSQRKE